MSVNTSHAPSFRGIITIITALVVATSMLFAAFQTPSAAAKDVGYGVDGNPVDCTNNWPVGEKEPMRSADGTIHGYSQMWWSDSCQANWVRAWTVDGKPTVLESKIWQGVRPGPDREVAYANDYAAVHFTMFLHAEPGERMCASSSILKDFGGFKGHADYASSPLYCRT